MKMKSYYYYNVIYPPGGYHFTQLFSHKHLERAQS